MNGGTVSMWVENTISGRGCSGETAKTLQRVAFDRNLFCLKPSPEQFAMKEISHRAFVAGDGLDVHELTGEGDDIHARQDTLAQALGAVLRERPG